MLLISQYKMEVREYLLVHDLHVQAAYCYKDSKDYYDFTFTDMLNNQVTLLIIGLMAFYFFIFIFIVANCKHVLTVVHIESIN